MNSSLGGWYQRGDDTDIPKKGKKNIKKKEQETHLA
jgi:hypothetical protein